MIIMTMRMADDEEDEEGMMMTMKILNANDAVIGSTLLLSLYNEATKPPP